MKILIIDQNILLREGLANLLQKEPEITTVEGANSLPNAIARAGTLQPDLALLDASMLEIENKNGIQQLQAESPQTQVIVFSTNQSAHQFLRVVRSGARGYIEKTASLSTLLACIRAVKRGEAAVPRALVHILLDEFCRITPVLESDELDLLTPREMSVLQQLGNGYTNRQIAQVLQIAENTVKVHVHNILNKLNLENRRQAARYARIHHSVLILNQKNMEAQEEFSPRA